ncbi:hypothetical protein DDN60_15620 [Vibrio cholerae]|nr:hypothetical protein [Vibrio cholerae]
MFANRHKQLGAKESDCWSGGDWGREQLMLSTTVNMNNVLSAYQIDKKGFFIKLFMNKHNG